MTTRRMQIPDTRGRSAPVRPEVTPSPGRRPATGLPTLTPGGPVPIVPTDTGPHPAFEDSPLTIHIACEACDEHLLVALPRTTARYGAVDCPACGSSYIFRASPRARR